MDKAITTTFMVIASVVCAVLVFNAIYPVVIQSSDAMTNMTLRVNDRLKSQVEIIHVTGEVDDYEAFVWVKNIGSLRIAAVERCDVFFGPAGNFDRIPHEDYAGGEKPYWNYGVEGDGSDWNPTATLKITTTLKHVDPYPLKSDGTIYFVKVIIPNGISDEDYFSVN